MSQPPRVERLVRTTVLVLSAYWLAVALISPVTVTDAHQYDLARLWVIRQGGLFANDRFVNFMQITYPWTFDAIHWPLLRLGAGTSLPSFACFAGTMIIVWTLVRERVGAGCAWLALLALLGMPTLVYQAVSVKTDIPILFGVCCWFYALERHRRSGAGLDLAASATALAFAAGAKVSGPLFLPVGAVATAWMLRHRGRSLAAWIACLAAAVVLLGSWETYLASWWTFRDPLYMAQAIGNRDGLAGAAANVLRRAFAVADVGQDLFAGGKSSLTVWLEDACRTLLATLGLADRGWLLGGNDRTLDLLKNGHEAQDAFGPMGTLTVLLVPVILLTRRPGDPAWRLAAATLVTTALVSAGIGFYYFQNRYFLLPFTLGAVATTLWIHPAYVRWPVVRVAFLTVVLWGAVVLPCLSYNRRPADLWRAIADRDAFTTRENPGTLPMLQAVRAQRAACPAARWVVVPRLGAWELLFYQTLGDGMEIRRIDDVEGGRLQELRAAHPDVPIFVLALGRKLPEHLGVRELGAWPDSSPVLKSTRLYQVGDTPCPGS